MKFSIGNRFADRKIAGGFFIFCFLLPAVSVFAQSGNTEKETGMHSKISPAAENEPGRVKPGFSVMRSLPEPENVEGKERRYTYRNWRPRTLPFLSGYDRNGIYPASKQVFVYLEGEKRVYPNLAGYIFAHAALGWKVNEHLSVTGGAVAVKQAEGMHVSDRAGAKVQVHYTLNGPIDFDLWGQYLTGSAVLNGLFLLLPATGGGAAATIHTGTNSQVGVSSEYWYDERTQKWKYESKGKIKLSF